MHTESRKTKKFFVIRILDTNVVVFVITVLQYSVTEQVLAKPCESSIPDDQADS
jgi:hypothetical protein